VIAVIVLAAGCALAALIYAYIYYTRIKGRPTTAVRGSASRGSSCGGSGRGEEKALHHETANGAPAGDHPVSTHIFMFKKSHEKS